MQLFCLTVDVGDTPENQQFMTHFNAELLTRFEQLDIYRVVYGVEVL